MLFCSALKHRNIFDQPNLSFARCTTLWEWDHPSFSQPIRLNFSFCNVLYYTKMHSVVHSLSFCLSFGDDVCSALHGFLYGEWWRHYKFCAFQASAPRLFSAAVQRSLLLTAGARPFFPHFFFLAWLCSAWDPRWALRSFVLWYMYLILTLNPSSQGIPSPVIRTLVFVYYIKAFLPD